MPTELRSAHGLRTPRRRAVRGPRVIAARRSASRLLLACGIALAVGCGSRPPLLRGSIAVDSNVNPDRAGRPSPIVVRGYELKSVPAVHGADFFPPFAHQQATPMRRPAGP